MKLIKENVENFTQLNDTTIIGLYKQIEKCARVCYKSDLKDSECKKKIQKKSDSEEIYYAGLSVYNTIKFVNNLIKSNHTAMLEHASVYLKVPLIKIRTVLLVYDIYRKNKSWARLKIRGGYVYLSTNLRVLYSYFERKSSEITFRDDIVRINNVYKYYMLGFIHRIYDKLHTLCEYCEGYISFKSFLKQIGEYKRVSKQALKFFDLLNYLSFPTEYHQERFSFKITTNIVTTRDLLRHRLFSFANESTRYCNYSKDKFGNEIQFILPYRFKKYEDIVDKVSNYSFDSPDENQLRFINEYDGSINFKKIFLHFIYNIENTSNKSSNNSENTCEIHELCDLAIAIDNFLHACRECEYRYMEEIHHGSKPQDASEFLIGDTKSEIVMTGFKDNWEDFLCLRYYEKTGKVRPNLKEIAAKIKSFGII